MRGGGDFVVSCSWMHYSKIGSLLSAGAWWMEFTHIHASMYMQVSTNMVRRVHSHKQRNRNMIKGWKRENWRLQSIMRANRFPIWPFMNKSEGGELKWGWGVEGLICGKKDENWRMRPVVVNVSSSVIYKKRENERGQAKPNKKNAKVNFLSPSNLLCTLWKSPANLITLICWTNFLGYHFVRLPSFPLQLDVQTTVMKRALI